MRRRKTLHIVIPSEARNPSSIETQEKKEGFLASLGMTEKETFPYPLKLKVTILGNYSYAPVACFDSSSFSYAGSVRNSMNFGDLIKSRRMDAAS
jgi:hypothetical protein